MGVAESLLNPDIEDIQMKEHLMKPKIDYYLKNFVGF